MVCWLLYCPTVVAAAILIFTVTHADANKVKSPPQGIPSVKRWNSNLKSSIIPTVPKANEEGIPSVKRWNSNLKSSIKPTVPKANEDAQKNNSSKKEWLFKDYMNKYRPINVWERMHKNKKEQGLNISLVKDFNEFFNGIDLTDDLLDIKVESKVESARRTKWSPPGYIDKSVVQRDQFSLRRRLYELILHVMYWTRNKLVLMQDFRKKYRDAKLYKMGFIFSKTDIACKMFHRFSYRAMHSCLGVRYGHVKRFYPIEILHAEERMNNKWFDITLLIDLIVQNDESAKELIEEVDENRKEAWEFQD